MPLDLQNPQGMKLWKTSKWLPLYLPWISWRWVNVQYGANRQCACTTPPKDVDFAWKLNFSSEQKKKEERSATNGKQRYFWLERYCVFIAINPVPWL